MNALFLFPVVWLGVAPAKSLLEFLKGWESYAMVGMIISVPLVVVSYLAGADVKNQLLKWTREQVLVRCFATTGKSLGTLLALSLAFGIQAVFLVTFFKSASPAFTALLFDNDPDAAQRYATLQLPVERVDGVFWEVAEAALQAEKRNSRSEDPATGRTLLKRFHERREIFRPAIYRYLLAYGRMKASLALGNTRDALIQAILLERIGRFLGETKERRGRQAQGLVYLSDREGVLSDRKPKDSLTAAIKVFQTDSTPGGQRNLGNCYFLNDQPEEAIRVWEAALSASGLTDMVEKKQLLNNRALGFNVLKQPIAARKYVEEGLTIPFDSSKERERREQIRLLATKAAICIELKDYVEARRTWNEREMLKVDQGSPGTYALQAQILARECLSELQPNRRIWLRAQLWYALAGAAGLAPAELELDTAEARSKLAERAANKFASCYRGLAFDRELVEKAMTE